MRIGRKKCLALLDTGSEITLVPRSLTDGRHLETSSQRLRAANGTEIVVCGEATLSVYIGRMVLPLKCLVVENVTEVLLGMDWMLENVEKMEFKQQRAKIGGRMVGLVKAPPNSAPRRVSARKSVEIPPRCEANVEGQVLFGDLAKYEADWITKPKRLRESLLVARTMVIDHGSSVIVRLINLSEKPIVLEEGADVCELEEVTKAEPSRKDGMNDAHLRDLYDQVDPSVSEEERRKLWALMCRYQHVFSRGPADMGLTTWSCMRLTQVGRSQYDRD